MKWLLTAGLCLYQLWAAWCHHRDDNDFMFWVNVIGCLAWLHATVKILST